MSASLRKSLKTKGFGRIKGNLGIKKQRKSRFSFIADGSTPYTIEASNIDHGENLKLKVVDENGVIEKARQSLGSDDPHLVLSLERRQRVRIVVTAERDSGNSGKIPFYLAVSDHQAIRKHASSKRTPKSTATAEEADNQTSIVNGSLESLWNRFSTSSSPLSIGDLDSLLGASIADDGSVSQGELALLNQIHSQLPEHVSSENLDYFDYIFGAAIGSNPANANFTGGVTDSSKVIKLGNLDVGSDANQVFLLQKKWFRGEDLPLGQIDGDSAAGVPPSTFTYAEATGNLFDGSPSYTQLAQGDAGTCWFLSSMNAVANASETSSAIQEMFIDNGDGTFGVRYYAPYGTGESAWVTVNKDLPIASYYSNSLKMAGSHISEKMYNWWSVTPRVNLQSSGFGPANLTWAALAEKGLAQVNETGILQRSSIENSYKAIEGGAALGIDYITGKADFNSYAYSAPFEYFKTLDPTQKPILLGSSQKWSGSPNGTTQLVSGHAYSIVDKTLDNKTGSYLFTVANPWGETAFNYDATFEMSENTLSQFFDDETIFLATIQ